MTLFLKFASKEEFNSACRDLNITVDSDAQIGQCTVSVIGLIPDGTYKTYTDDAGLEVVEPNFIDGWHVNAVGVLPNGWETYLVEVSTPTRIFG